MKKSYSPKNDKNKVSNYGIKSLILVFGFCFVFSQVKTVFASPITEDNVLQLINQERINYNLKPLKEDAELDHASGMKSRDMINRNYFDHYAFGLTPWIFIQNSGYNYSVAGENLAMDFATSEGMVQAWMNSPEHRSNILNPHFEDTGIGVVKGAYTQDGVTHETTIVTNMFGQKKSKVVVYFNNLLNSFLNIL